MQALYLLFDWLSATWQMVSETSAWLLFGFFLAGVVHVLLPRKLIERHLQKPGFGSVLKASAIGVPLPLCSCSVIPTAITLKKAGASNGATSSFLISGPESGVDSLAMTYALMDLPMTIMRPVAAFCSALVAGWLNILFNSGSIPSPNVNGKEEKSWARAISAAPTVLTPSS